MSLQTCFFLPVYDPVWLTSAHKYVSSSRSACKGSTVALSVVCALLSNFLSTSLFAPLHTTSFTHRTYHTNCLIVGPLPPRGRFSFHVGCVGGELSLTSQPVLFSGALRLRLHMQRSRPLLLGCYRSRQGRRQHRQNVEIPPLFDSERGSLAIHHSRQGF